MHKVKDEEGNHSNTKEGMGISPTDHRGKGCDGVKRVKGRIF